MLNAPVYKVKAELFKTLGHPARIRALELLRGGEKSVSDLMIDIGIEASHLSQQLAVLRRANLVQTRKDGSRVLYSVGDEKVFDLLDVARNIVTSTLIDAQALLAELEGGAEASQIESD